MTEEHEIQYYPLDFDALEKGQAWTPDDLERLTEKGRGTDPYRWAVLAIKDRIVRECKDRGKEFTLAVVKGCLRILTDEEAAVYNASAFRAGIRRSRRSYRRLARTVDAAKLTEGQAKDHERNLLVCGRVLVAAKAARSEALSVSVHSRSVPGLPGK